MIISTDLSSWTFTYGSGSNWYRATTDCKCGAKFEIYVSKTKNSLESRRTLTYHGFNVCSDFMLTRSSLSSGQLNSQVGAAYDMVSNVEKYCVFRDEWRGVATTLAEWSADLTLEGPTF